MNSFSRLLIIFVLFVLPSIFFPKPCLSAPSESLYVTVRTSKLRVKPKHYAGGVVAVKYGDALVMLDSADGWIKVKNSSGQQGYIHQSSVSTRKVVLKADARFVAGDAGADVVLAGKGFSPEVEKSYQAQNANVDYRSVDEMERLRVNDQEIAAFISNGKLG